MRKVLALMAAVGFLLVAAGCDHCDSCHSDNYRRTQNAPAVAVADSK